MLTNVLFGQPSGSAADPLPAKATEGPGRQQDTRSFSDHLNDRSRQYEKNSASEYDSSQRPDQAADQVDESKATAQNAQDQSPEDEVQADAAGGEGDATQSESDSSDVASTESAQTQTESDADALPAEVEASQDAAGLVEAADELGSIAAMRSEATPASAPQANVEDGSASASTKHIASSAEGASETTDSPVGRAAVEVDPAKTRTAETPSANGAAGALVGEDAGKGKGLDTQLTKEERAESVVAPRNGDTAQVQNGTQQRAGARSIASAAPAVTAKTGETSQGMTAALSEVPQSDEAEAEVDVEAIVRDGTRKPGIPAEVAASVAGQVRATGAAEPGRRAQGRAMEAREIESTTSATRTETGATAATKATATAQMSAVQQAFVAQALEADVSAAGARGDAQLLSGELGADWRGLSQILTEAALQPGTVHRPEVPRQIGAQLAAAFVAKGDRNVDVALNPEELGRVKMRVSTSDSGITMVIQTERPETADLMRRHINELADEFRKMGFDNISFEFSGEGAAAGGGMADSETSAGSGQSGTGKSEELVTAEVAETAIQHLNLGGAGVDMRV
ncbi:flagellar hook-length control protein FliK [Pseudophaeobacter sp.]|uniref:flagellar hook-length control protein FliK n=1 Tax=Pseudophaeobacter sp. TaxID=1971739 RepID=UPI004059D86E